MSEEEQQVWQHINDVQQYVREKIEAQYPGMRVSQIAGELSSRYMQPLHALNENPDYILESTIATFHFTLDNKERMILGTDIAGIRGTALLGSDGRVEIGPVETWL